jgi:predicted Rossmann fold flavoprotein
VNGLKTVIVIGGGAAGMMAAVKAAEAGAKVTLVERNEKVGRKIYITGKGRCNLTNDCSVQEALQNYPRGGRFLYSSMSRFTPADTKAFFTGLGVELKTERGNRVFPVSDHASDIIDALFYELRRKKVDIVTARVKELTTQEEHITGVCLDNGKTLKGDAVIIATGGASYPATGSTGDGYELAKSARHTIVKIGASLVPLTAGEECAKMMGLSLRNIKLKIKNQKKKVVFEGFGELLFTHFGLSGPLVLSASAHLKDFDKNKYSAIIDLKPALDEKQLDERILRDFGENPNREIQNVLGGLLPRLMIPVLLERTNIQPETRVHDITKAQRHRMMEEMKGFRVDITGTRPIAEAIVTTGGVKLSEVNPSTMESKKLSGLYFAGEVLDIDGYTGGFNLQAAWATGAAAGQAAASEQ